MTEELRSLLYMLCVIAENDWHESFEEQLKEVATIIQTEDDMSEAVSILINRINELAVSCYFCEICDSREVCFSE